MRRVLTLIIVICTALSHYLLAQNAPISTIADIQSTGPEVAVPITVINFDGIAGCTQEIFYDHTIASIISVELGPAMEGELDINISTPGVIRIGWYTFPALNLPDNSTAFILNFSKVAVGYSSLSWSLDYFNRNWSDGSGNVLNDLPLENYYINGSLTFDEYGSPITFAPDIIICNETSVMIPITVKQFNNVGALSLTLQYDTDVLQYQSFINNSSFPGLIVFLAPSGDITISGFVSTSPSVTSGIFLPDDATLLTLVFNYAGGNTNLSWFDNGVSCEYTDWPFYNPYPDVPQSEYYIDGSVSQCQQVNLKLFLEGLYNASINQMNKTHDLVEGSIVKKFEGTIADLITVELRNPNDYSTLILQVNDIPLHQNGSATFEIEEPLNGQYYITIKTRNHLETVSALPVNFNNQNIFYDFTTEATQAYENNMKELEPGVWGIYAGDINGDGIINLSDRQMINNHYLSTTRGYFPTDINGDGIINLSDRQIVNNAYLQTITSKTP